jgi:hypothetical protein
VSIQEHWLFTFEKQKLIDYCLENNYICFLKCCDEMGLPLFVGIYAEMIQIDISSQSILIADSFTPIASTFHHFNGYSVSQIDYISPFKHCDFITDIKIHHRESLNTSTHDPVSG